MHLLFHPLFLNSLAEISLSLSAAWLGVVLILPGFASLSTLADVWYLTKNLGFAILFLLLGFALRVKAEREKL